MPDANPVDLCTRKNLCCEPATPAGRNAIPRMTPSHVRRSQTGFSPRGALWYEWGCGGDDDAPRRFMAAMAVIVADNHKKVVHSFHQDLSTPTPSQATRATISFELAGVVGDSSGQRPGPAPRRRSSRTRR
ncbi:hypothetical protein U9M48_034692 [Paspalum notatum var. saurae]|uniref:Uncharacterized protein n=1 Tax=Paspalum notatum var. saurae TaxID=547442 RepID=A0AAQ3UAY9_PASNO